MRDASTNAVLLIGILVAFVTVVAIMIRKSMNSTEELRRELEKGYSVPEDGDDEWADGNGAERNTNRVHLVLTVFFLIVHLVLLVRILRSCAVPEDPINHMP
jgi:hypothetical protein